MVIGIGAHEHLGQGFRFWGLTSDLLTYCLGCGFKMGGFGIENYAESNSSSPIPHTCCFAYPIGNLAYSSTDNDRGHLIFETQVLCPQTQSLFNLSARNIHLNIHRKPSYDTLNPTPHTLKPHPKTPTPNPINLKPQTHALTRRAPPEASAFVEATCQMLHELLDVA